MSVKQKEFPGQWSAGPDRGLKLCGIQMASLHHRLDWLELTFASDSDSPNTNARFIPAKRTSRSVRDPSSLVSYKMESILYLESRFTHFPWAMAIGCSQVRNVTRAPVLWDFQLTP